MGGQGRLFRVTRPRKIRKKKSRGKKKKKTGKRKGGINKERCLQKKLGEVVLSLGTVRTSKSKQAKHSSASESNHFGISYHTHMGCVCVDDRHAGTQTVAPNKKNQPRKVKSRLFSPFFPAPRFFADLWLLSPLISGFVIFCSWDLALGETKKSQKNKTPS